MVSAAMVGMDVVVVGPGGLKGASAMREAAEERARETGASVVVTDDLEAVAGADFVYTDVWLSMGEDAGLYADRVRLLSPYRVDAALLARTGNPDVKVLHDLPALHNLDTKMARGIAELTGVSEFEITDEVFEANADVIFDQAENRMHTIKAVLVAALGTRQ